MQPTIEALEAVKTIICHRYGPDRACADGTAAALILDIVPANKIQEHITAGTIVLDHHDDERTIATTQRFGLVGLGVFGLNSEGQSGAWLAHNVVWKRMKQGATERQHDAAYQLARFVGTRDCWLRDSPAWKRACCISAALDLFPWDSWADIPDPFGKGWDEISTMLSAGTPLYAKKLRQAEEHAKQAWVCMPAPGLTLAVINTLETSDLAELVDADILAGFHMFVRQGAFDSGARHNEANGVQSDTCNVTQYSLRSRKNHDVGAIAKAMGGGGHRSAAGFQIQRGLNPYADIVEVVRRHVIPTA